MAHYLLIARFTMDDIPLRLFGHPVMAKDEAKQIEDDPSLLATKWRHVIDMWPNNSPGGFVDALVLQIDELSGYPLGVTFDSTADTQPLDPQPTQPLDPQPIQSTIPVPDGYVEITDPNHKLRPYVDFYLSLNFDPGEWISITETDGCLVSDWGQPWRFCCPADKHPDRQPPVAILAPEGLPPGFVEITDPLHNVRVGIDYYAERSAEKGVLWKLVEESSVNLYSFRFAYRFACPATQHPDLQGTSLPAETDELTVLREANEILVKKQVELVNDIEILRKANADLNHRLNATLARASHATDLESRIRRMAINFVQFHAKLRERRVWSSLFAAEKQMPLAYTQALMTVDSAFTDVFVSFLQNFPHVQPDMPDEWQIDTAQADDDDGTTD